ncbi:hypothetical protein BPAE_0504g00050 [Botrytis paeoniae]|uniref:Uncharacterized protein n=1 Tax=Botrytis paeoniae TaxID=278948 RepID=A0A4Z1EZS0_9HELO|nr:hypothetical protein BPAE_0504g00050 [Botrytis paeoniae]
MRLCGRSCETSAPEIQQTEEQAIGHGGLIRQVIQKDPLDPERYGIANRSAINVQLFGPETFRIITGKEPPPTPIMARLYAEPGLPIFKLYEEKTGIWAKSLDDIILKIDEKMDWEATGDVIGEENFEPSIVTLNRRLRRV